MKGLWEEVITEVILRKGLQIYYACKYPIADEELDHINMASKSYYICIAVILRLNYDFCLDKGYFIPLCILDLRENIFHRT